MNFSWLGDLCERSYSGCTSGDACTVNWNSGTICVPLSASQQQAQDRSYYCNGTCRDGYNSTNNYTCEGKILWKFCNEHKNKGIACRYWWM